MITHGENDRAVCRRRALAERRVSTPPERTGFENENENARSGVRRAPSTDDGLSGSTHAAPQVFRSMNTSGLAYGVRGGRPYRLATSQRRPGQRQRQMSVKRAFP